MTLGAQYWGLNISTILIVVLPLIFMKLRNKTKSINKTLLPLIRIFPSFILLYYILSLCRNSSTVVR